MPLAIYIKENTAYKLQLAKRRDRFFFGLITAVGLASIIFAILPFAIWQLTTLPRLKSKIDQAPIPQGQVLSAATYTSNIQVVQDPDGFSYFVPVSKPPISMSYQNGPSAIASPLNRPAEFYLTIPKLKIVKAKVLVDSLNFYDNLSHFPGSALPGEVGNSFITGHSVLPQFNDPKNYRAIFTKLSELEIGDDVYVEIEGKKLHFSVQYLRVVNPHDTSVINPISTTGRNLTLMTCVPPGTNLKRLVVVTNLI